MDSFLAVTVGQYNQVHLPVHHWPTQSEKSTHLKSQPRNLLDMPVNIWEEAMLEENGQHANSKQKGPSRGSTRVFSAKVLITTLQIVFGLRNNFKKSWNIILENKRRFVVVAIFKKEYFLFISSNSLKAVAPLLSPLPHVNWTDWSLSVDDR